MAEELTAQGRSTPAEPLHAIADRRLTCGMSDWLPVLHRWLARYHDIQVLFNCAADQPASPVGTRPEAQPSPPSDHALAQGLARLDFLPGRLAIADDAWPRWNPRKETLCDFIDANPPIAWPWDSEYPTTADIEAWLLQELARSGAARDVGP